jgi:hypothetical protein
MALIKGQWFRTIADVNVGCIVQLSPPHVRERPVVLGRGELFAVTFVPPFESPGVTCRPHRYSELERAFVDPATRDDPDYRGYVLAIDGTALERDCEPVPPIDERLS